MAKLPGFRSPTVDAIYRLYEERQSPRLGRRHLGASLIGKECTRYLWYVFRWCVTPDWSGRMLRLFDTGEREEARIVRELRAIGIEVHNADPRRAGRQYEYYTLGDHFGGSLDGVARGFLEAPKSWAVCEMKTHNDKSFKALREKGVKVAKPEHHAQMQVYMALAKLKRAAYIAVSKATDFIHFEWIRFDKKEWERLRAKAERVLRATEPLTRYSDDPFGIPCGWCPAKDVCHEGAVPPVSCRTCVHSTPIVDGDGPGLWRCERKGRYISAKDQERACDEHLFIPALVPFAKPVEAGDGYVLYQLRKKNGGRFANVGATGFVGEDVDQLDSATLRALGESN
ncbi:MAG: PD-(D/E)XK nuclease family protein [Myxococcota bacterium]